MSDGCIKSQHYLVSLAKRRMPIYLAVLLFAYAHSISKKHLWRYAADFEFRWNHRKVNDHDRTVAALAQSGGKILTYRRAVEGA